MPGDYHSPPNSFPVCDRAIPRAVGQRITLELRQRLRIAGYGTKPILSRQEPFEQRTQPRPSLFLRGRFRGGFRD